MSIKKILCEYLDEERKGYVTVEDVCLYLTVYSLLFIALIGDFGIVLRIVYKVDIGFLKILWFGCSILISFAFLLDVWYSVRHNKILICERVGELSDEDCCFIKSKLGQRIN